MIKFEALADRKAVKNVIDMVHPTALAFGITKSPTGMMDKYTYNTQQHGGQIHVQYRTIWWTSHKCTYNTEQHGGQIHL